MMSQQDFIEKAGFDVAPLIREIKNELGAGKVRVFFDNPYSQAMSRYSGDVLEIHLPTLQTIMQQRPELTREAAIAKIKAQVAEELCHGVNHETNHDERVVSCTIREMNEHMTPSELAEPYIQQKIEKLQAASSPVQAMEI